MKTTITDYPFESDLIRDCAAESILLLQRNLTPLGILAATPSEETESRRYTRIFGRDAAICALGMVVTEDRQLHEGAKNSLVSLAEHQAENGQIPKYIDPEGKEADFWYVGCIDATLWWLIAVHIFNKFLPEVGLEAQLKPNIKQALTWLHCQEHQRLYLLQQNEASDWADIMPRSGFVLYTNALWYIVKRLYFLAHCQDTKFHFNHLFYPFSQKMPDYHRLRLLQHYARRNTGGRGSDRSNLYLSFVNFSFCGEEGDVFGNLLAILFNLASDSPAQRILHELTQCDVTSPYPVRAVCRPIERESILWRRYMTRHNQNIDYQYHNGGVWPFIGSFWVMALAYVGEYEPANVALTKLAEINRVGNWGFYEWFHGLTGEPSGMRGQSWNAATFLLALHCLNEKVF